MTRRAAGSRRATSPRRSRLTRARSLAFGCRLLLFCFTSFFSFKRFYLFRAPSAGTKALCFHSFFLIHHGKSNIFTIKYSLTEAHMVLCKLILSPKTSIR